MRTSIYLPEAVVKLMREHRKKEAVNWSAICRDAILERLGYEPQGNIHYGSKIELIPAQPAKQSA